MVSYKIMVKEKNQKRWTNFNRNKYQKPQIETFKTKTEATKRVKSLSKLWRNDFKVKKL